MGRRRHREFSHKFIDPAHKAIAESRGRLFAIGGAFTPREQTFTDVTHEDGDAPFSFATRR